MMVKTYELALGASQRALMKSAELQALAWPLLIDNTRGA